MMLTGHVVTLRAVALLTVLLLVAACDAPEQESDYVARVGNTGLTAEELDRALTAVPSGMDVAAARDQYIEQWMTSQLLAREALRRGLRDDDDVRRQLEDNERNVLASALLATLYDEDAATFSRQEIEAYFERHREGMRLREPYVRVRYIESRTEEEAASARGALTRLYQGSFEPAERDSLFILAVRQYARDTTASLTLASSFVPQSRLARQAGTSPWSVVAQMDNRETSSILEMSDSTFVVVQLVERVPAGEPARIEWVADEITQRLAIQTRKQLVAREVHRLRSEAEARGELRTLSAPGSP